MKRKFMTILAALFALVALVGCSQYNTQSDQVALEYNGHVLWPADKKFLACHEGGKQEFTGSGNDFVYLPTNQRSYDATGAEGSERGPFTVVSDDNAELRVPISVTFYLKSDCDNLREFYETVGRKYGVGMEGNETNAGWARMLDFVIQPPLDVTLDRVAQKYDWREIWNNEEIRVEFEQAIKESLPNQVKQRTNGKEFFTNFNVLVQKPDPVDEGLKQAIVAEQKGVAEANAALAKANADKAAADAQVFVAEAQARARAAEITGYGSPDDYNKARAIEKGLNPYQPSYGQAIVQPGN